MAHHGIVKCILQPRFHHPEQARKAEEKTPDPNILGGENEKEGLMKDVSPSRDQPDWEFAQSELLEREGVDLKMEMEQKMKEMEELWRKEKEEASQAFQQERKKYEDQIETLQKQVL